jgi:hypothetical protein
MQPEKPSAGNDRSGAVCDDPDGVQGILAYRNECHFMKTVGDNGNPAEAPDLSIDPSTDPSSDMQGLDTSNSGGFNSQSWLSADPSAMSVLTPSSGGMYDKTTGSGDTQPGLSNTPDAGHSGGPTPNSSTNSAREGGVDTRGHLSSGHMNGSGRNSFQPSPVSPRQQQHQHQQQNSMMGTNDMSGGHQQTFFGDTTGFSVSPTIHDQQNGFGMSNGWGDMQNQAGIPQVGDGVLRALMNMGPMDAMDLSSWDQGNENMRQ